MNYLIELHCVILFYKMMKDSYGTLESECWWNISSSSSSSLSLPKSFYKCFLAWGQRVISLSKWRYFKWFSLFHSHYLSGVNFTNIFRADFSCKKLYSQLFCTLSLPIYLFDARKSAEKVAFKILLKLTTSWLFSISLILCFCLFHILSFLSKSSFANYYVFYCFLFGFLYLWN